MAYDRDLKGKSFFNLFKYYRKLKDSFSKPDDSAPSSHRKIIRPSIEGFFKYRPLKEENEALRKKIEELEKQKEQDKQEKQELQQQLEQEKQKSEQAEQEWQQKYQAAEHSGKIDGLTKLQNKKNFEESLTKKIASAILFDKPLSLILFDLDNFKGCNDYLGHLAGDECLKTVGSILKESVRKNDIAARIGGDEFAIVLYDTDIHRSKKVTDRVLESIKERNISFKAPDSRTGTIEQKQVSASAGIFHIDKRQWEPVCHRLNINKSRLKQAYINLDSQVTTIEDKKLINEFEEKIENEISPYIRDTADRESLYRAKNSGKGQVAVIKADFQAENAYDRR